MLEERGIDGILGVELTHLSQEAYETIDLEPHLRLIQKVDRFNSILLTSFTI
jgi:hypothetical protein